MSHRQALRATSTLARENPTGYVHPIPTGYNLRKRSRAEAVERFPTGYGPLRKRSQAVAIEVVGFRAISIRATIIDGFHESSKLRLGPHLVGSTLRPAPMLIHECVSTSREARQLGVDGLKNEISTGQSIPKFV